MPRRRAINPRTNVIAVRVTPKMRFGLELLAQERGATLTDIVILAVDNLFGTEAIGLLRKPPGEDGGAPILDRVWSPQECERVVRLGIYVPELMSDRQRYLWSCIRETRKFWKRRTEPGHPKPDDVNWEALAKDWPDLERRADDVK